MNENLLISIQISLLGMTLVFLALILMWGLMELLVRLAAVRTHGPAVTQTSTEPPLSAAGIQPDPDRQPQEERLRRQRVAVLAVSLALTARDQHSKEFPIPPTAIVSAWQAVNRANMLNRRGQVR